MLPQRRGCSPGALRRNDTATPCTADPVRSRVARLSVAPPGLRTRLLRPGTTAERRRCARQLQQEEAMHLRNFFSGMALVASFAPVAESQVTITPMVGGYIPASDIHQVQSGAQNVAKTRDGTLSLGANIDFGALRGTVAYASGTTIKNASSQEIGKGSVLATTADLV